VLTVSLRFAGHIEDNISRTTPYAYKVVVIMSATAPAANVVFLETHPGWRASRTRSDALTAAMRRHPSYQGDLADPRADREPAQVLYMRAH
jgi:hypothetical protein